ncbi:hypothetical protein [Flexivirga sp. B27]
MTTNTSADAASAIRGYAAHARESLRSEQSSAVSYAGLWLLLASVAPVVEEPEKFRSALGLDPREAMDAAARLLSDPHPAVGAAMGSWLAPGVTLGKELPVTLDELPAQSVLDEWARDMTRGVLKSFPVQLSPDTMLVLASALVLTPRWARSLGRDEFDDMLVLRDGLQAVVDTSVGPVAVARPDTEDGVDVVSVIAGPDVAAPDVWPVVNEVLAMLDDGSLRNNSFPGEMSPDDTEDGHAWTSHETVQEFWGDAPEDGSQVWESRLPEWSVSATHSLESAPAVDLVAGPLQALLPPPADLSCVQNVAATYDDEGFSAAAVTAMGIAGSAPPRPEPCRIRQITLSFDRPHAVVAVARGGAWDGIPLFHAWVDPKERTRYE